MSEAYRRMKASSGRMALTALVLTMTSGCDNTSEQPVVPFPKSVPETPVSRATSNATPSDVSPITTPSEAQLPDHNYDEREGSTYYYIAVVSEEDRKRGRAVGNVSSFQYFGQNSKGEHIIASIRMNGTIAYRAKCSASCRIIDTDDGEKIAYSSRSIIGGAFQDAFRGKLRITESEIQSDLSEVIEPVSGPRAMVATVPPPQIDPTVDPQNTSDIGPDTELPPFAK